MGLRKEAIASASERGKRYLSCKTASSGQNRSLLMFRSSPVRESEKRRGQAGDGRTLAVEEFTRVLS